jgi:hypothetical protein
MTANLSLEEIEKAREKIGDLYITFMEHIILRLGSIADSLSEVRANPTHADNWRNAEFCYLQIRKVCEYLALSVLVAHDLYRDTSVQRLAKDWHAAEIFSKLLGLNPYAFPIATVVKFDHDGPGRHHIEPTSPVLDSADLDRIYGVCGDRLYAGTLKRILASKVPPYSFEEIADWRNKLVLTLNNHMVRLPHIASILLVTMRHEDDQKVHCAFADAEGPFVIGDDPTIFEVGRLL